ncbi:dihydrolipoamide acetyltransferase family protein [Cryptosporangium arvum]|uniref:dihydrolipoamide acetyltransferase family protein n=1 Tax=Cryptosporangium arvum TaxID=80871 RepID=UPI0004B76A51|nr:dihydrolipoamide acetyltransferase family protein [Cryptosporangium arvum]
MSAQTFVLPDLGEGLTEAAVVRWLVTEGDAVTIDQPVAEVETAKAVVEVPTPFAGTVTARHVEVGHTATVGDPLLSVTTDEPAGSGNVLVGYGTTTSTGPRRHRRPRAAAAPVAAAPPAATAASPVGLPVTSPVGLPVPGAAETASSAAAAGDRPRVVSPLVRRLAQERGVDVRTIRGSGHGGLILRRDVEAASPAASRVEAPAAAAEALPAVAPVPARSGETRVELSPLGKAAAGVFERSRREIPDVTIWADVDATPLVELRAGAPDGPGLLAYLARFTVAALREHPVFNARFDAERRETVHSPTVHLGLAVQGANGLVVPAVPHADTLTTTGLDAEIRRLTAAARNGEATSSAGTFTLNNYGAFRVDGSTPILTPPNVGMLGVGRIIDRPWVVGGELAVRKVTTLSFVFDHRVCDGRTAADFLRVVADAIENPAAAIARL